MNCLIKLARMIPDDWKYSVLISEFTGKNIQWDLNNTEQLSCWSMQTTKISPVHQKSPTSHVDT